MLAHISRSSTFDPEFDQTAFSTELSFTYLDDDEANTREVKFTAVSNTSQEEADTIAYAEMRDRVKVMVDFLDSQFPEAV